MIKMTGTIDDREVLVLGLSEMNLQKLREGKPIHIFGAETGIPVDIVIFWGETEDKLAETVKPLIDPETRVTDHRTNRPKKN